MRICIFGMGYVGCVTAACFAEMGHKVLGVEPNQVKVDLINSGKSPIIEKDLTACSKKLSRAGRSAPRRTGRKRSKIRNWRWSASGHQAVPTAALICASCSVCVSKSARRWPNTPDVLLS